MVIRDDSPVEPASPQAKVARSARVIKALEAERTILAIQNQSLSKERDEAVARRDAALLENEKLLLILSQYKRAIFGRHSEKIYPDQLRLLLSGAEAAAVVGANENDAPGDSGNRDATTTTIRPRANLNRGRLPAHLPRIDVIIDIAEKACPCCGAALHKIGETQKAMLDIVPVQYRVKRVIRPR